MSQSGTAPKEIDFNQPGRLPAAVRLLVNVPWAVKRQIWANPFAWRVFAGTCRRLGWNESSLGVYRSSNGPFAGIAIRAVHTNHLWVPMGGYEADICDWLVSKFHLERWVDHSRDVIDVGAYMGLMSLLFARHASRVFAFEPSPVNRQALEQNLACNPDLAAKIIVRSEALSDRNGSVEMTFDGLQSTNQLKVDGVKLWNNADNLNVTQVETRTIDSLLPSDGSNDGINPGFIKIDVEGAEGLVLAGAKETLRKCRPALLVETHNDDACNATFVALRNANYSIWRLERGVATRTESPWPGGYGHVVALPTEKAEKVEL